MEKVSAIRTGKCQGMKQYKGLKKKKNPSKVESGIHNFLFKGRCLLTEWLTKMNFIS